ncbi:Alcohol dehydrogenase GroES domain protein [Parafrankia sp. Ea1.12]|uniref:zinc-dependent alcohol dehydrogenase n=1 Tax=Parafrankia sp. Ea1.12 TaxID=573499 RepID=UPI000DA5C979|nr:alcohol dehydrogenase catalytic domain-containing protein [Parafrankia sp. Ea1.12]SQD96095.1 Alcohol dehydrogenase GroES domain protein [Parafrankia sp. Ea1.12]
MKAVRGHEGRPVVIDVAEPPGWDEGELLNMAVAGICASDLNYLRLGTRFILGHELAGRKADGTPVLVEGQFGCGRCDFCREGRNNLCDQSTRKALGIMQNGGMVEQFRVPAHKVLEIPAGLDVSNASLAEPAAVAWHGARVGGTAPGRTVVVVGGGSIGQLAAVAAQTQGAAEVVMEARYPHQHAIRERMGVGEPRAGERYDVVIEAAGSPSSLRRSVELVKPGGTVSLLGVHQGGVDVPYSSLLTKEVTLVASMGYCGHAGRREMLQAAEMLAARPEIPDSLITHRFPLEDAAEAFRVAGDRESGAVKVVVEVG